MKESSIRGTTAARNTCNSVSLRFYDLLKPHHSTCHGHWKWKRKNWYKYVCI